jgi:hypothetical protein
MEGVKIQMGEVFVALFVQWISSHKMNTLNFILYPLSMVRFADVAVANKEAFWRPQLQATGYRLRELLVQNGRYDSCGVPPSSSSYISRSGLHNIELTCYSTINFCSWIIET